MNKKEKEILNKLFKIAMNQQKVIDQLVKQAQYQAPQQYQGPITDTIYQAPEVLTEDVSESLEPVIKSLAIALNLPQAYNFMVTKADVKNGELEAFVIYNKQGKIPGEDSNNMIMLQEKIKMTLRGKTLNTAQGIPTIIKNVNIRFTQA